MSTQPTSSSRIQKTKCFVAILLSSGVLCGCDSVKNSQRRPLTVLVAASAAQAVSEVARDYEHATGTKVHIGSGPSNGLAQQIISGVPADIFISASSQWTELITDRGLSIHVEELFANQMVLIVPSLPRNLDARIQTLDDLLGDSSNRIAIAGKRVPAGVYAESILRNAGCYDQLREKSQIVRGSDARITTTYVERGEADAGIVFKTDAVQSSKIKVVETLETDENITYTMALLNDLQGHPSAQALFDKLRTSTEVWEQHGFQHNSANSR